MEAVGLTQLAICDRTEISQGSLSRYCNGAVPPLDQLEKLLEAFPAEHQRLIARAYLEDNVPGPLRGHVRITVEGERAREEPPVYRSRMRRELLEAWEGLGRKAIENPYVADSLIASWRIVSRP